ncbi:hypothetical protein [Methylobacter sp.]|uniref:hypothetical protein n=1 Tax=Methylobacter sp. TaxID=2051955 RepID=UPI002FDD41E1
MKRLALTIALAGILCNLNGCAVYATPYDNVGISYNYAPYGYGYGLYGSYGFRPHFYGGGWRGGYGWGGHRWGGRGWGGRGWR